MAQQNRDYSALVAESAAAIIDRLHDRLAEVTRVTQQVLVRDISELPGDAQLQQLLRDNVAANIETTFSAIRNSIPIDRVEPPTAALEYARRLAQREVPPTALIRAYRIGHQTVLAMLLDEVRASDLHPELRLDAFKRITEVTFSYIDWITQQVIVAYQDEHDRWQDNRNSVRALRVRELLDSDEVDADLMTTALRYPLRRTHLSLVLWRPESGNNDELALMERLVVRAAESVGAQERPLFVSADPLTGWAWIPLAADAASTALPRLMELVQADSDAPHIAAGEPLPGITGFRRSHEQATDAHAVAIASGSAARRLTSASESGVLLAALLSEKPDGVRRWVGEVLGPLAAATDNDERLRDTLRVFLRTGSSYTAAADELHLHFNSVRRRVQRAQARRGRPISDDRLDVEVALLLCHLFGAATLR
jgi:DNA-binding PucR family transcriptional regulator